MIESHLKEGNKREILKIFISISISLTHTFLGRQDLPIEGPSNLVYGQSITDACISWETTVQVLNTLREGVRARRARNNNQNGNIVYNE